jgi:hypothetical protein
MHWGGACTGDVSELLKILKFNFIILKLTSSLLTLWAVAPPLLPSLLIQAKSFLPDRDIYLERGN